MDILILHGLGGYAGVHWQGWLKNQLEEHGHAVMMPTLPQPNRPDRTLWLQTVRDLLTNVNTQNLILVGHSLGVPVALDFIEQSPSPLRGLLSVAGFCENYKSEYNDYFMSVKTINFEKVNKNLHASFVVYSDNDPYVPQPSLRQLADMLKVKPTIIPQGGHFNKESGYSTFPLLVELIESLKR